MFDVCFIRPPDCAVCAGAKEIEGTIQVGSLEESFWAVVDAVSVRDYMMQWVDAVNRLEHGSNGSALVTCFYGARADVVGIWWVLFRMPGNRFAVHEQLILRNVVGDSFHPSRYCDYLPPYEATSTDGKTPISEWHTTLAELSEFKQRVIQRLRTMGEQPGS